MNSVDPSAGAAGVDNDRGGMGPSNRGNFGLIGNRAPPHSRGYNGKREPEAKADPYLLYGGYYGYGLGYGYGGYGGNGGYYYG